jgi:peptide-methionine (R)-S-oxide reductase
MRPTLRGARSSRAAHVLDGGLDCTLKRPATFADCQAPPTVRAASRGQDTGTCRPTLESAVKRRTRKDRMGQAVVRSDEQWRELLSSEQYAVLRQGATERAGSGRYAHSQEPGTYRCAGCGARLFASSAKYDSGTGWPSFTAPVHLDGVEEVPDRGLLGLRTEVRCRSCASHLGHVFRDGPRPGGLRYCMNSAALDLGPDGPEAG